MEWNKYTHAQCCGAEPAFFCRSQNLNALAPAPSKKREKNRKQTLKLANLKQ